MTHRSQDVAAADWTALPGPARPEGLVTSALAFASLPLARFLTVGSLGLLADATVFSALSIQGAPDMVARAASLGLATLLTWQLNRLFTFGASGRSRLVESARYALVAAGAQGFNYALFLVLRALVPGAPALAALLVSAGAAAIFSFAGQRFFTFARDDGDAAALPAPASGA